MRGWLAACVSVAVCGAPVVVYGFFDAALIPKWRLALQAGRLLVVRRHVWSLWGGQRHEGNMGSTFHSIADHLVHWYPGPTPLCIACVWCAAGYEFSCCYGWLAEWPVNASVTLSVVDMLPEADQPPPPDSVSPERRWLAAALADASGVATQPASVALWRAGTACVLCRSCINCTDASHMLYRICGCMFSSG